MCVPYDISQIAKYNTKTMRTSHWFSNLTMTHNPTALTTECTNELSPVFCSHSSSLYERTQ